MRIVQEIKVECATQQEFDNLVQWIEEQEFCTVEFDAVQRLSINGRIMVSISPWGPDERDVGPQWAEFCKELKHAVSLNG